MTVLLRTARILRRVLETSRDISYSNSCGKSTRSGLKRTLKGIIIIIIIIIIIRRRIRKRGGGGNRTTCQNSRNYSISKIGQKVEKSPRDLRKFAFTEIPVKIHYLTLV